MTTIIRAIAVWTDDWVAVNFGGWIKTYNLADNDIISSLSAWDQYYIVWRFANITIPQWTIITNATLKFTASDTRTIIYNEVPFGTNFDANGFFIYWADLDDVSTFTNDWALWISSFSFKVTWNTSNNVTNNTEYTTPDIKTIIQWIVDRWWWDSWNALVIALCQDPDSEYYSNWVSIYSYVWDPSKVMELEITYDDPPAPDVKKWNLLLMF